MSSRWDLVIMYACIPCAGRCHCRASTGSWVPVFSVRKLGQFLRALSGLLQCVADYRLPTTVICLLTLVVLTSGYQLSSVFWLWAGLGRLWRIDVATTRRPKNIAGSCAWELSRLVEHHPSVFGGWATLCPVTLSALTLLLRAPRSTRHADTRATHRGAFRLMTVAHLQEMFNRLHQLQSWFADYSRWDVYNPFWKTHSPYAQQDEQLGQKHSNHFSSRAIQELVTFFSVLWEQLYERLRLSHFEETFWLVSPKEEFRTISSEFRELHSKTLA